MKKYIATPLTPLCYALCAIPLRMIFRIKSQRSGLNFDPNIPYIIASNHPTILDPWLALAALPRREFCALLPIRFMTSERYMIPVIKSLILAPFGCISTKPSNGKKTLEIFIKRLGMGERAFIFPNGKLDSSRRIKPKAGAVYLERAVKNALIFPIRIKTNGKLTPLRVLTRQFKAEIIFGEPFRHTSFPKDLQPLAEDLMIRINSLY